MACAMMSYPTTSAYQNPRKGTETRRDVAEGNRLLHRQRTKIPGVKWTLFLKKEFVPWGTESDALMFLLLS